MIRCVLFLLASSAFACLFGASPNPPSTRKLDGSWKVYSNRELGYCVSFPSHWLSGDAFDGAGMYVETGVKKFSRPLGEIDIGAVSDGQSEQAQSLPLTPVEYLQTHLDGLKKFERAQQMEVLEQKEMQILGTPALFTKDRYFDPQDGAKWVDEIMLVKHQQMLYRMELECRADQLARFEPIFFHFAETFKFDCNGKH